MCKRCNQKKIEKKCCDDHHEQRCCNQKIEKKCCEKRCCKPNRRKFVTKCCGSKYERCNLGCKKSSNSNIPQNYCFEKIEGPTIIETGESPVEGPDVCFFIERFGKRVTINIPSIVVTLAFSVKFEFIDPKYRPKEKLTFLIPSTSPDKVFLEILPDGTVKWQPSPPNIVTITTPATSVTYLVC